MAEEKKDLYWPCPSHCAQVVTPLSFFPRAVPLVSREIPLFGPDGSDTPGGPPVGAGSSVAAKAVWSREVEKGLSGQRA